MGESRVRIRRGPIYSTDLRNPIHDPVTLNRAADGFNQMFAYFVFKHDVSCAAIILRRHHTRHKMVRLIFQFIQKALARLGQQREHNGLERQDVAANLLPEHVGHS